MWYDLLRWAWAGIEGSTSRLMDWNGGLLGSLLAKITPTSCRRVCEMPHSVKPSECSNHDGCSRNSSSHGDNIVLVVQVASTSRISTTLNPALPIYNPNLKFLPLSTFHFPLSTPVSRIAETDIRLPCHRLQLFRLRSIHGSHLSLFHVPSSCATERQQR